MSESTVHTVTQDRDTNIDLGGVRFPCFITAEVEVIKTVYESQNMSGRMEDAVQGDEEIRVGETNCSVVMYTFDGNHEIGKFETSSKKFYDCYFDDPDAGDIP